MDQVGISSPSSFSLWVLCWQNSKSLASQPRGQPESRGSATGKFLLWPSLNTNDFQYNSLVRTSCMALGESGSTILPHAQMQSQRQSVASIKNITGQTIKMTCSCLCWSNQSKWGYIYVYIKHFKFCMLSTVCKGGYGSTEGWW